METASGAGRPIDLHSAPGKDARLEEERIGAFGTGSFESTVSALCSAIVVGRCRVDPQAFEARRPEVLRFVIDQYRRMPDHMRLAMHLATRLFDWAGLFHGLRCFSAGSQGARWRQVQAWRRGPLSACRDFIRFYESLIVYCWYAPDELR